MNNMKDDLGNRMKLNYEDRTRYSLPRRTYTIIRLDQKCGHTYTKGLDKPFDKGYMEDMDNAVIAMLPEIQGAVFAYLQSDECSILLTDFSTIQTDAWFDGNIQKMASVSASIITAEFNKYRTQRFIETKSMNVCGGEFISAYFDSRVFTIPDRVEVMNMLIWRNQDCARNSVSMVAQANFSHKELQGKSTPKMHEMLHTKGVNWATDYTDGEKNGRLIVKESYTIDIGFNAKVERTRWVSKGAWKFTEDKEKLLAMIPKYE
jgi:tRNA(His) 5'-end guanylyltransferase